MENQPHIYFREERKIDSDFFIGSQPRELLFPGRAAQRALNPSGQAGNYQVLLIVTEEDAFAIAAQKAGLILLHRSP